MLSQQQLTNNHVGFTLRMDVDNVEVPTSTVLNYVIERVDGYEVRIVFARDSSDLWRFNASESDSILHSLGILVQRLPLDYEDYDSRAFGYSDVLRIPSEYQVYRISNGVRIPM